MPQSKHYVNANGQEIDYTLTVDQRPNLRDEVRYMLHTQGKHILEKMFDSCEVDPDVKEFHLEFPERWANMLELRAIPFRMLVCFPNLEKVTVLTHSVFIIQSTHSEHIRIIRHGGDLGEDLYEDGNYEDLTKRYCPSSRPFEGLWVSSDQGLSQIAK